MKGVRRLGTAAIVVAIILSIALPRAEAHRDDQSYLVLDVGEQLTARVQMPFGDISDVLDISISPGQAAAVTAAIETNQAQLIEYAREHIAFIGPAGNWELDAVAVRRAEGFSRHVEVEFAVNHGENFQEFTVLFDPFFDEIEDRDALLVIGNDLRRGVINSESDGLLRFTPDSRSNDVDLGSPQHWRNFWQSIQTGIDHIRTGPDHLLFIFTLMLPSVLVFSDGWKAQTSFRSTLWRVIKLMTMFTVAHSVTFSLAGLGIVPQPSSRIVETAIALSIVATAFHNLRPIWQDREWIIAFIFGLFHGFGFASLVTSLEVSTSTQLISLLGRNVGIEIGQIIAVILVFPMMYVLRVFPLYRWIMVALSLMLALVGAIWALERITDRQTTLTRRVDDWLVYPRILVYVAIATGLAVAYRLIRQRWSPQAAISPLGHLR